jgi:acetylornithine deacetylase/succinyl-diaminopimelate desuccinylase-like protein
MNLKERIAGNIKFIFQPGEELLPGGASLLINEGVLLNPEVDCLIAQHVTPQIPSGKIGFRKGLFMASTDEIYITIKGKGGHAAMPDTYINPLLIASALISKLHDFFMINKSENMNQIPTVLAFGKIEGLGATNVIPSEVKLAGTFRTLNEEWRALAHSKIAEIVKNNKPKISSPYLFDGFATTYLQFNKQTKTVQSEFIALKGQKYKLHFCSSGFEEKVTVTIKLKANPKKEELIVVSTTSIVGSTPNFTIDIEKHGTYFIEYELPVTALEIDHKECVMLLNSYSTK